MEYFEFNEKVEMLKRLYPNLDITPEVIYDYILVNYNMRLREGSVISNYLNK